MKKIFKVLGYLVVVIVVVVGGLIGYVKVALPNVGEAPELKVEPTPAKIARGKYLATSVSLCISCHSERDWTRFSGPIIKADSLGMGGEKFDQKVGMPGIYYAKNITPAGISRYSDGELFRAITTGVTKEGTALFPLMPYSHYGKMDPEDIYCIIAYIRSLRAVDVKVPESVSDFPMNIIINTIPAKAAPVKRPDPSNTREYGAYMVNASGCIECHTKENHGQIIPELAYSGGREFLFPDGSKVRSANITPDVKTGIGSWTEDMFIGRFKAYADSAYKPQVVAKGAFNTVMPWTQYAQMTHEDLAAIYAYLHSVKAMENQVVKYTPAASDVAAK
jgi:Cytochrome c